MEPPLLADIAVSGDDDDPLEYQYRYTEEMDVGLARHLLADAPAEYHATGVYPKLKAVITAPDPASEYPTANARIGTSRMEVTLICPSRRILSRILPYAAYFPSYGNVSIRHRNRSKWAAMHMDKLFNEYRPGGVWMQGFDICCSPEWTRNEWNGAGNVLCVPLTLKSVRWGPSRSTFSGALCAPTACRNSASPT